MSNDYLWDRSGIPDLDVRWLEELLAPLAHDAPLDELRLAKGRRGEPVRATAQEPMEAPRSSGRVKGKMNILDKRIIGAATLTAAALGLLGVTAYTHHAHRPDPWPWQPPLVAIAPSFAMTPHDAPVAPMTGADLAIAAGESARIHVPVGTVDVEIQSRCNADIVMSLVTWFGPHVASPGDPPKQVLMSTLRQLAGERPLLVPGPASESRALGGAPIVVGTDSHDGRAHTYHLGPVDPDPTGLFQYTSRCAGQPPLHGVVEIDREDATRAIGPLTNARVFNDAGFTGQRAIHVYGSVLPGATVSVGGTQLALQPPGSDRYDLPISPTFSTDVPIAAEHPVAAVRVDDAMGTHFYVSRRAVDFLPRCDSTMAGAEHTAAALDDHGDHAGALRTFKTAMIRCAPDRDTLTRALEYACKAGDVDSARTFWRELPEELQRTLEPACVQHSITREQLAAP
jgi:hypothetical protein